MSERFFCITIGISCGSANIIGVCKSTQEEPMDTEAKISRLLKPLARFFNRNSLIISSSKPWLPGTRSCLLSHKK